VITLFFAMNAFLKAIMKDINIFNFRLLEAAVIAVMIKLGIKKVFAQIMENIQYKEKSSMNFLNYFAKKCS
jgi:hypothetical protein